MPTRSETGFGGASMRRAWYAVAILTIANVSGLLDRQILSLLVTPMKADLGISDTQISLLGSTAFVVFYALLGFPIGRLVDRASRRAIVGWGVALWSLFTILTGASRNFVHMLGARVGVGVGEATLGPAAVSIIGDAFPKDKRGFAMGVFGTAIFFGSGLGYFIGAQLVGAGDVSAMVTLPVIGSVHRWQAIFAYVGLPGFVIAALAFAMKEPMRTDANTTPIPLGEVFAYFKQHARTVVCMSLGFASSAAVNWAIGFWGAVFFERTYGHQGWTAAKAGSLMGIFTMTIGVAGALLGGRLTDRWTSRGVVDAPLRIGMIGAGGMLVLAGLWPLMPTGTLAAAMLIPINLFAALPWGAINAAIADALPSRIRGQGSSLYQMLTSLIGGLVGPSSVALLTDHAFHDPNSLRYSISIVTVVGMAIAVALIAFALPAYRKTVASISEV